MDSSEIAGSTDDLHSIALPEFARVTHTHLELNVDFNKKVLEGKAILTIERESSVQEVILDNHELVIKSVRNLPLEEFQLTYYISNNYVSGCFLIIELPRIVDIESLTNCDNKRRCQVQIEYETSPNSPALHWLTPEQTADGVYPFLLSDNKQMYARAWFPCQDTPSVKFKYTAKITVPRNFTVLMSALLVNDYGNLELDTYEFRQINPVPSYTVIIAVGSLQKRVINYRTIVFAEKKYIDKSFDTFRSKTIESMLHITENLYGFNFYERYDVFVLPPSIAHFQIECPYVTFISPTLLGGDHSCVSVSLSQNISRNWAGNSVTCVNYSNLWLNKSFSIFISRKIICQMSIHLEMNILLKKLGIDTLNDMIQNLGNAGLLCLVPNLTEFLPHEAIGYVPYERGCVLLNHLQDILGGPSEFDQFLKSYFVVFAYKSINTKDWKDHLYEYFPDKKEILDGVAWNEWFYDIPASRTETNITTWETNLLNLAKEWLKCNEASDIPIIIIDEMHLSNVQKVFLLCYLDILHTSLTDKKLKLISDFYSFDTDNGQIRSLFLVLCIKVRWAEKVESALNFAIEFCSPNTAYPIFKHLYEWEEMREQAIETYNRNKGKMLYETQKNLDIILHIN